jgi:hypothetical protein
MSLTLLSNLSRTSDIFSILREKNFLKPENFIKQANCPSIYCQSETVLKYFRLFSALLLTAMLILSYNNYPENDFFFYYSNWGSMMTTLVFWMLFVSHRPSKSDQYHIFTINLFEITIAMEYLINPLYWSMLYEPKKFNPYIF